MTTAPSTSPARSGGQSQKGGNEAPVGRPMRIAATRASPRRCTTALTKCVVPITTPSIAPLATAGWRPRRSSAVTMPSVTSAVVGVFTACTMLPSSSSTASVLVPPTSMPMRLMAVRTPDGTAGPGPRGGGRAATALVEDCGDEVFVPALRLAHPAADADRLRHGEVNAPLLDFGAGARGFAGGRDRAHLDADLAARPLHPFPARHLGHDRLDAARVIER